jgi:TatD DNase family protein
VKRGLYAGLNGIMTFTRDSSQLEAARLLPIKNILLETDAPFLTPNPLRGTINEPKHVILITQFLSKLRDESQALLAKTTTQNAKELFNL